jgi:hypothetical protein
MLGILYGLIGLFLLIVLLHMFFSVYYTPGVQVLYDTPLSQKLFPYGRRLWPTWGYNSWGRYDGNKGYGKWWPRGGSGYIPNKYGSTGADPAGGMRPRGTIPLSIDVGWWGGSALR